MYNHYMLYVGDFCDDNYVYIYVYDCRFNLNAFLEVIKIVLPIN